MLLAVGAAAFCGGVLTEAAWQAESPQVWEVHPELRAELEPAFQEYLRDGPLATGRVEVPGGALPVELIDSRRGAYYCVVPLGSIDQEAPDRVWVMTPDGVDLMNYRPGYLLAILDPRLAFRVLDPPEGGTLWERPAGGADPVRTSAVEEP